jgi:hypothetical protein
VFELQQDIGSPRFRHHLQVHKFEAYLFVTPGRSATLFPEHDLSDKIHAIRQAFPTPEDINDNQFNVSSK